MDTITHGIAGALIGKAFFAEKHNAKAPALASAPAGRVAIFALTLGNVFPDIDVFAQLITKNDLAIIETHRGITHSFVCLPIFALGLAALTRWISRRQGWASPSWAALAAIYALGLALHIALDLVTSFGTMIWSPLANTRVAWDMVFIVDLALTGIVLLPQVAAWVHRPEPAGGRPRRALAMWILFTLLAAGVDRLARAAGFPLSPSVTLAASGLFAAVFFLPAWLGWRFRVRRASWCRAGVCALAAYLSFCVAAHRVALKRVERFAAAHTLCVERIGALPLPPSAARWAGLVRTPDGVYQSWFDLWTEESPAFTFFANSPPNSYMEAAQGLPRVKTYLWFARFPVLRYWELGERHIVEFSDLRFARPGRNPGPFTFRVTFDAAGRILGQGWADQRP